MNNKGLCFRCEHRAFFLETGSGARFECSQPEMSVMGCYMFQPVKPICIKPREGDDRPLTLNYFSARAERVDVNPDMQLTASGSTDGILVYWKPKEE